MVEVRGTAFESDRPQELYLVAPGLAGLATIVGDAARSGWRLAS
jgi:hypothetical protein